MIETRPDWVVSRQRAWGVPIAVFVNKETGEMIRAEESTRRRAERRIVEAFAKEGADAWFEEGATERFLGSHVDDPAEWEKVDDILDVWFEFRLDACLRAGDSGPISNGRPIALSRRLRPASRLVPLLAARSCGTRGRAPYDAVLTHGFVLDEEGARCRSRSATRSRRRR